MEQNICENGATLKQIASATGTHFTNVALIVKGKTWRGK
jgi:hypothetical protein